MTTQMIPVGSKIRSHDFFVMNHSYIEGVVREISTHPGFPNGGDFYVVEVSNRVIMNESVDISDIIMWVPVSTVFDWEGRIVVLSEEV